MIYYSIVLMRIFVLNSDIFPPVRNLVEPLQQVLLVLSSIISSVTLILSCQITPEQALNW